MNDKKRIIKKLRHIFCNDVLKKIKSKNITDKSLDKIILDTLINIQIEESDLEIKFSEPRDEIYKTKSGRTPYDLLCEGKIKDKSVKLFINNKFGNLNKQNLNDVTTYNNLLRLYTGVINQRLTSKIEIDKKLICNRIKEREIIMYGIFVMDINKTASNFFLLEEIKNDLYINPRNTMLQVKYKPELKETPYSYYEFVEKLLSAISIALRKNIEASQTELITIEQIKNIIKLSKTSIK